MTDSIKKIVRGILRGICDGLPRSGKRRRVLLVVKNTLVATYLQDFQELFANDHRITFHRALGLGMSTDDAEICRSRVTCNEIPLRLARILHWDLVVMADHGFDELCTPRRFAVLRIPHGIGSKMVDGYDFMYGPRIHHPAGDLKYTRMFESSEIRQRKFINEKPELREVIALVGDLRVDNLRAKSIGNRIEPDTAHRRPNILIAGSWNPQNLFEKMGAELLNAAMNLQDCYSFTLRPHPHMLRASASGNWREFFNEQRQRGFTLSMPDADLGDALAAADVVICDDLSSVALYAAVLQLPILMVKSGSSQIPEGSFPDRLGRVVPELSQADQLEALLGLALDQGPSPELLNLAAEMNSRPGQGASLVRQEVYKLLQLAPP